ncbi:MAG TPA: nicotinate-nucleotide adenylyltransferase [Acidimicrobiales bacterium]|nr:nicotinate-nucleotide adenylyltransferase [Acidimicrobiales bacterium]
MRPGARIGILGGTFDPVHVGHLVAATWAREAFDLERVLLVVANVPWQKVGTRAVTPAEQRFLVVEAAVAGVEGVEACRMEIDRGGPSYSADTVDELLESLPSAQPYLIVGADVAAELGTWQRVDELREAVTLVVVDRGGVGPGDDPPGWRVERLRIPALDISSSQLRRRLAEGRSVDFLVPEAAIRCIRRLNLYAGIR